MVANINISGTTLSSGAIADICERHDVAELSVFGSALRPDFDVSSDVDFLVAFKNDDYGPWMGKLTALEAALSRLLGRPADVVPRDSLKWVVRDRILDSARLIYVASD